LLNLLFYLLSSSEIHIAGNPLERVECAIICISNNILSSRFMTNSNILYRLKFDEDEELLNENKFYEILEQLISFFTAK
jgi:hypothetical protein